nr:transglycosylase SLT domain-containing protein [Nocardioides luti]
MPRPTSRLVPRLATGLVGAALAASGVLAAPAQAADGAADGADRRIVEHRVRAGETATSLAVRFHAWTDELVARNHLGRHAALQVGQVIEIPVVVSATRGHHHRHHGPATQPPAASPDPVVPGRERVRRVVARTAVRQGLDPQLALAVAWQESGWRMGVRSDAGAIGALQVLPGTGRWMELYAGRPLDLRTLADNAYAGTRLLALLQDETSSTRRAVAAYYQGLGAVRRHGLFDESRPYVRSVLAIRGNLEAGRPPA